MSTNINEQINIVKNSEFFDDVWYVATYPDVTHSGLSPEEHYLSYGAWLGRDPGPKFSTSDYLAKFPELVQNKHNPLLHFLGIDQSVEEEPVIETVAPPVPITSIEPYGLSLRAAANEAEEYAKSTLEAYNGPKQLDPGSSYPKVSVVITCFDADETIERSVLSMLSQDYPNLEVIVVDDKSSDQSWRALQRLQEQCPKFLRIIRCNVNGGTYLAKNMGVQNATGEIILFQDSDDYSHPARVTVQVLPLLSDPNIIATRTMYLRFNPETGKIIPVAGKPSKLGLITLAVRKQAFHEIGYFDAVRRAGDDEWFQRLQHLYGRENIKDLNVSLYLAELRQNSLVADMITFNQDGSVEQTSSKVRKEYVKKFRQRFEQNLDASWFASHFQAMPIRAHQNYPDTIAALPPVPERVIGNICSIPQRIESFRRVLQNVLAQVDELNVFLDKFDRVPDFLENNSKIRITRSQDVGTDPRDNAKFFAFNRHKTTGSPFYYFTFDDDIIYPHDYVRSMIDRIKRYDNRVVATVHGVIYEEYPQKYFRRRFIYHFQDQSLVEPKLVNNAGTGTVAFHSDIFGSVDPNDWPQGGMVDIFFANLCRQQNVPILCVDRHSNWLCSTDESEGTPNLFTEYAHKERLIVAELQKQIPWGHAAIENIIAAQNAELQVKLKQLLPPFHLDADVSTYLHRFR